MGNIILLEQGLVANGTTGQSGGFIRKLNSDPFISQLSRVSFDAYQSINAREDCGFITTGLTYTISSDMLGKMQHHISGLNSQNYPIKINIHSSDIALVHEGGACFIDTQLTCANWVGEATRKNAFFYEHAKVDEILMQQEKVYEVNST